MNVLTFNDVDLHLHNFGVNLKLKSIMTYVWPPCLKCRPLLTQGNVFDTNKIQDLIKTITMEKHESMLPVLIK